ncbi:winged helix DNA-binding domain-containing protein [Compostibacter hankyongensis]|uniref:Winged helix DNA-binding domain-containing protein n=1 Tax=Compostibacter hankyongensis TaxID=1007089 RepID=A0ABP8FZF9_9BACT
MNTRDIARMRLYSQQIAETNDKRVMETVYRMGAMQAQDYAMAKWAIGLRLPGATDRTVEEAIAGGTIIRTHVLRPTWHFVAAEDIRWMLALTAPRLKASLAGRHRRLELSPTVIRKSHRILEKALSEGEHLTREALLSRLEKAKIATTDVRGSHLLLSAELEGILCSGATKDKKITYALLAERVPETRALDRDEALAMLAERYFSSHGPATVADFSWWSGLSGTEARKGLDFVQHSFLSEKVGDDTYWFPPEVVAPAKKAKPSVYLLPAFDEYIIGYKDRKAVLPSGHQRRAISNNGIFWPVVVVNGQVTGIWKRTLKKNGVDILPEFFDPDARIDPRRLKAAKEAFVRFLMTA